MVCRHNKDFDFSIGSTEKLLAVKYMHIYIYIYIYSAI